MGKTKDDAVLDASGWQRLTLPDPDDCHYAVTGHESQVVTLQLREGDYCKGEPGSMMYLSGNMDQSVACEGCCERCCSGEICCVSVFANSGNGPGFVALTPSFPTSKVVPVNLSQVGGTLIAQQGSFMASYGEVHVGVSLDWNFMRCCCGGLGLVRQRLEGSGTVFLSSTGTMVQKVLQPGEVILVDTNSVMAFAGTCTLDLRRAGGVMVGTGIVCCYSAASFLTRFRL